jgi:hypothetical protein
MSTTCAGATPYVLGSAGVIPNFSNVPSFFAVVWPNAGIMVDSWSINDCAGGGSEKAVVKVLLLVLPSCKVIKVHSNTKRSGEK